MTETVLPMFEVLYKGNHYLVSNACYQDGEGNQMIKIIRMADINSNRKTRNSIIVKASDCRILRDWDL